MIVLNHHTSAIVVIPGEEVKDHPVDVAVAGKLFEPTNEWQAIEPSYHLPGGLWIRINLATGQKEARDMPK
ncbi:unnamed protein product [Aphanomyces euteiches]